MKVLIPVGVFVAIAGFCVSIVLWVNHDMNRLTEPACYAAMIGGVALAVYAGQHRSSF